MWYLITYSDVHSVWHTKLFRVDEEITEAFIKVKETENNLGVPSTALIINTWGPIDSITAMSMLDAGYENYDS